MLQDLDDTFKGEEDQFELKDANEDVAEMVKAVNDSLHQVCDFTPLHAEVAKFRLLLGPETLLNWKLK